ncbi:hypothetical protein JXB01_02430 [Candidatus Micrarchaeota archaeon]|nr:hypothetical protein [Candidatus Micrarchaeota archaeon]
MVRSKREMFLKRAKKKTAELLASRDVFLGKMSKSVDDINDSINVLTEKLEDLYAVYFPELKIKDREKFVLVAVKFDKSSPDAKFLSKIVGSALSNEIINKSKSSMGADLSEEDIEAVRTLAERIESLYKLKEEYESYIEKLSGEICPNISAVAGSAVASKLIAHAGSLEKLAMMPASTIQVIGAEKALFKHLRNKKIKPPKHGIIFQHTKISTSPKRVRGKIARALATKIATAAKADAFTKNFIGEKLKSDFEKRYNEIMENYKKGSNK